MHNPGPAQENQFFVMFGSNPVLFYDQLILSGTGARKG
jgi:hypothetical protein